MSFDNKTFEKQINEYFTKLIYAAFEDIGAEWNGDIKFSPLMYQNYKNLCEEKKNRCDGLKSRFTVSDQVRQMLTFFFINLTEEINNIAIADNEDIHEIGHNLRLANADCYSGFMLDVTSRYRHFLGPTLVQAGDTSRWFYNKIIDRLPQYSTKHMVLAIINAAFDMFIKSMAWLMGKFLWYVEMTISEQLFLAQMAQLGMSQDMIDVLQSNLRPRPVPKPRAKKSGVKTVNVATTGSIVVDTETAPPVDNIRAADDGLPAAAEAITNQDDLCDALLGV